MTQGELLWVLKIKASGSKRKSKKDGKKTIAPTIFEPVAEVQVIKKKGKKEEFPE